MNQAIHYQKEIQTEPLAPQTVNITVNQVNQTQTNTVNVQTAENTTAPAVTRMPGWPAKWPVPSKVPRPFLPPSFTITPKMLE
jgi:hypothetical protein